MNRNIISILGDPAYFLAGHRHYSKKELVRLLKKSGFEIKEVKYNGGIFTILFTFVLYFYKHILKKGEPKGLVEKLMGLDYKNKGFYEVDIRAEKVRDVS